MIKFISYIHSPFGLCDGIFTVMIDDKEYRFGHNYENNVYDYNTNQYTDGNFNEFWKSGGKCESRGVLEGPWELSYDTHEFPEWIIKLLPELIKVFNENVPAGCCGACY